MSIRDKSLKWFFYLSLTQLTVHSDIETLAGAEIDISSDDRENVPEAIESESSEKVTIVYGIWLLSHKLVLPLF